MKQNTSRAVCVQRIRIKSTIEMVDKCFIKWRILLKSIWKTGITSKKLLL